MGLGGRAIRMILSLGLLHLAPGSAMTPTLPSDPARKSFRNVSLDRLTRDYLERLSPDVTSLQFLDSKIGMIEKDAFDGLTHLNGLEIFDSEILKSIDPETFARLPGLEILILGNVSLKRVDLNLLNVQELILAGNEIETFDERAVRGRNVNFLDLSDNELKVLNRSFSNLSKLSMIDVSMNKISQVTPDVFEGNPRLLRILASYNNIESTEGFRLPWLKSLNLFDNKIEKLDSESFSKMVALEKLTLAFNRIKLLGDAFKDLVELKQLNLAWNQIEELSPFLFRNNLYLTELALQGNKIKSLEKLEGDHHRLTHLDLSHNEISVIGEEFFRSTPALRVLNLKFNRLTTLSAALTPLKVIENLNLAYNHLVELNLSGNSELILANLSGNGLREGVTVFKNNQRLTELDLSRNKISNFCNGNDTLKSLLKLNLRGNQIGSLSCLMDFPSLCEVDMRENPLTCNKDLDALILILAERKEAPCRLVEEFKADVLPNQCENLSLNRSLSLWNSIKRELCRNGRDFESKTNATASEWEKKEEKATTEEGRREKESMEVKEEPPAQIYIHKPLGWLKNDEMNKPNPMDNPQSGRQSWGNIEENSELMKGFEDEEIEKRPRFSWYTIALILIGLSLTLTCFNLIVFLYIKMKVWKRNDSGSQQKYVVLHNEIYKNTTEPSAVPEGEYPTENGTRNKIFTYEKINEILLNFGLNKKDKDPESDKNILIHSSSVSRNF